MSTSREWSIDASALVALLGLAFVVVGVSLWYVGLAPTATSVHGAIFALVMHVLFGGIILVLGVHLERSELAREDRYAVIRWCYGGFLFMAALSGWGHLGSILAGQVTSAFASDFVVFTSLGGAFGVIAGINWGRAARNARLAEHNEAQRETLALLTRLLSHDIRNDMGIVRGYADLLVEHVDEAGRSRIDVIRDRVDETVDLVTAASTLVKSLDEDRAFEAVDLSVVLVQASTRVVEAHPEVAVETDVQSGLVVEGDALLDQLFANLLQNAVVHNDAAGLTIAVTADRTGADVAVVVEDDGTGIPPERRETCFELGERGPESRGDGIGLYLVSRLAAVYGGSVALEESPSGGARFVVTLPAAPA